MLECIVRALIKRLKKRNIRSAWKKTGILPPNLENALSEVEDPQPSNPSRNEAASERDLLQTPFCARDVDLQVDYLLDRLNVAPRCTRVLGKLAKAAKEGQTELLLANREIGDLRRTADLQAMRKRKVARAKGGYLGQGDGKENVAGDEEKAGGA